MRAVLILSALVAAAASDAGAQNKPSSAKPDSGCTTFPDGRIECIRVRTGTPGDSARRRIFFRTDSAMMNRAALGIELRPTGTRRDTLGVFVVAVTPRGPAETAGIIEGDRIAAVNGIDLRSAAADVEDAYTNGIPAHRLSREVKKLSPGTRVTLRVYSGGRFRDVVVTTGRASELLRQAGGFNFGRAFPGDGMEFRGPDGAMMFGPGMPHGIEGFGHPGRAHIRSLPRKTELRRAPSSRLKVLRPGVVAAPLEGEVFELEADELPELEAITDLESEDLELTIEPA